MIVYAGRRRAPRYTPAEDSILREMVAAGASWGAIGRAVGHTADGCRKRALALGLAKANCPPGRPQGKPWALTADHCRRCGILLTVAPGHDGLCGWCVAGL